MDLGIAGRKAIVCASSRGLGRACATALAQAGCEVVINGRDRERLAATAAELQKATGAKITPVAADVASADGQKALFAACPEPDILVNNNAGPPFRDFRELDRARNARRRHCQHDRGRGAGPESDRSDDRQEIRPHRQYHVGIGEGADRRPRSVLGRARRSHRIFCRRGPQRRCCECDHQFPVARRVRNRSVSDLRRDDDEEKRRQRRRSAGRARRRRPSPADRRPGRVRRGLRISLLGAGRLHHRPKSADRWWGFSGCVLQQNPEKACPEFDAGWRPVFGKIMPKCNISLYQGSFDETRSLWRPGREKPGMLDAQGRVRDLSKIVPDIAGDALSPGGRPSCASSRPTNCRWYAARRGSARASARSAISSPSASIIPTTPPRQACPSRKSRSSSTRRQPAFADRTTTP